MATLFEMVDKVKPKTKRIVIGIVLFGVFIASLPDQEPVPQSYTAPVTTPKTTASAAPVNSLPNTAFVSPSPDAVIMPNTPSSQTQPPDASQLKVISQPASFDCNQ